MLTPVQMQSSSLEGLTPGRRLCVRPRKKEREQNGVKERRNHSKPISVKATDQPGIVIFSWACTTIPSGWSSTFFLLVPWQQSESEEELMENDHLYLQKFLLKKLSIVDFAGTTSCAAITCLCLQLWSLLWNLFYIARSFKLHNKKMKSTRSLSEGRPRVMQCPAISPAQVR